MNLEFISREEWGIVVAQLDSRVYFQVLQYLSTLKINIIKPKMVLNFIFHSINVKQFIFSIY